ncbi:acyl carrier protein [Escherichia coli]|uniref:acyl carrier protein n=1 Tax=Escherichia coli TaxID=562 RepID=UPI002306EE16|nr:acyl carrier protein [Escherichia coli]WCE59811.1 acyl carrier protein [Escherichia coli]
MEHALHAIWQRVLDRQDIDSNASFFALGGTSLDTIRVKGDIKRQLGLEIDITDLFKYPTLFRYCRIAGGCNSNACCCLQRHAGGDRRYGGTFPRCGEYCSVVDAGCRRGIGINTVQ